MGLGVSFSQAVEEVEIETTESTVVEEVATTNPKKSDYQLKLEEKEAKRTVRALKKQNQLERSILKLESTQRTDEIKLGKLNERHSNTKKGLTDVQREKLELKIAKLEMKMAKDKARLKKLRRKVS